MAVMKTQALKALSARRTRSTHTASHAAANLSEVSAQDPLWYLFARHQTNPFARFLRAAFFYDETERDSLTRDRSSAERPLRDRIRPA
jgi:hypothetical protein